MINITQVETNEWRWTIENRKLSKWWQTGTKQKQARDRGVIKLYISAEITREMMKMLPKVLMIERSGRERECVCSICLTVGVYGRENVWDITPLNIILMIERIQGKAESVVFPQHLISSVCVDVVHLEEMVGSVCEITSLKIILMTIRALVRVIF